MAINPNTALPNKNTLYLAMSGFGKSQALLQNPEIPKSGARVILWDIDHDHKAQHFDSRVDFIRALKKGLASGKGFRVAFSGADTVKNFEWFCSVVWEVLDGNKVTFVVIEELADVCETVGKASPMFGKVLRKGRKFGGRLHLTSQRGTEIPKTAYTQCPNKWVGGQEGNDIERMAKLSGVKPDQIEQLQPLEYYFKQAGQREAEFKKLKYKPVKR